MAGDWVIDMWTRGDYGIVGDWFAAASRACLPAELDGRAVLDVACGTGSIAIEAARRGARVVGVDLTPSMLETAAQRAAAAGVEVDWQRGSFDDLSAYAGRFDVVTSGFGVIFANDQPAVARELVAACRPGGTVALTAWRPEGSFGQMPPSIVKLMPALKGGSDPTRWATEAGLAEIFAGLPIEGVEVMVDAVEIPFPSVNDALDGLLRWSGPWQMIFEALDGQGKGNVGRTAMRAHIARYARATDAGVVLTAAYAVARVAVKG